MHLYLNLESIWSGVQVAVVESNLYAMQHLIRDLHAAGISLCLDFVFNHTSDEHEWARAARAGDAAAQELYLMYPNRTIPDQVSVVGVVRSSVHCWE